MLAQRAPTVSFTHNAPQCLGTPVQFTDSSSNQPTDWDWNFGDDTGISTEQNPAYIYAEAGSYTVSLVSANGCGPGVQIIDTVQINGAKFISDSPKCDGQEVHFTDQSTGTVATWKWDFGDNTGQSYQQNPVHTYAGPGEYTVTLTTTGNCATPSSFSRIVYIGASTPVANFSSTAPTCSTLEVKFYDFSTNAPANWQWDFGDGSPISHEQNPVHVYVASGTYTVTLISSNGCGTSSPFSKQILVNNSGNVTAAFNSNSPICYNSGPMQFTDTSTGSPTSWLWNFGDGGTSTAQNPTHTYSNAGNFIVTMRATNACSQSEVTHQVSVDVNAIDANFTFDDRLCRGAPVQLSPAEVLQNYNNGLWRYTIKATPTITWSNPATITYGTALSGTQLNANASVPGSLCI